MARAYSAHIESEGRIRNTVVEVGRAAYQQGLMPGSDGNLSIRLDADRILITPAGLCKGRLQPDDLLVVNQGGKVLVRAGDESLSPSSELLLHLEVYRQRPDAQAAIHAHPPFCSALTLAGIEFPTHILPELILTLGEVPCAQFALPGSPDSASAVAGLLAQHDAILLSQHGSLTIGRDLYTALTHLERIEHAAKVFTYASLLGESRSLPQEIIQALLSRRKGSKE